MGLSWKFHPTVPLIRKKGFPFTKKMIKLYLGERPYACEKCGKRFVQRAHLRTHIRIVHEGKKVVTRSKNDGPAMCNICGKTVSCKRNLKVCLLIFHFVILIHYFFTCAMFLFTFINIIQIKVFGFLVYLLLIIILGPHDEPCRLKTF